MKPALLLIVLMSGVLSAQTTAKTFAEGDCTAAKLGTAIPAASIGEPVSAVTLNAPVWTAETVNLPAFCSVDGAMAPVTANGKPINFRVLLPALWNQSAAQLGGGGMDGSIPNLTQGSNLTTGPSLPARGFVTYGSDSGHQSGPGRGGARGPAAPGANDWALSEEAVKNLAYMQLKKTHDAAMVLIGRAYGEKPRFNYFF